MTAPHHTPSTLPTLRILGTRGVPAAHGGFETFAERLSLHLVGRGWRVVVYCQEAGRGVPWRDVWRGIDRVHVPVAVPGAAGTMLFDWHCIADAARHPDLCLTLGYNTALFSLRLRLRGVVNLMNMDGVEWRRAKWGPLAKAWFWLNDWAGCQIADHLIADHPEIQALLRTRTTVERISTIPYGADATGDAPVEPLAAYGLRPGGYLTLIARPEPENAVLEAVRSFSSRPRGVRLVVLGDYVHSRDYDRAIRDAASSEVDFLGAVYEPTIVAALRAHCIAYVHGHRVGGTNPSLVEALGAGNAVIAHDNRYNRWVAGDAALYFQDGQDLDRVLGLALQRPELLDGLRQRSRWRHETAFRWDVVLAAYERLLLALAQGGGQAAKALSPPASAVWPSSGPT